MRRTPLHRIAAALLVSGFVGSACGGRYSDAERFAAARRRTIQAGAPTDVDVSPAAATSGAASPAGGEPAGAAGALPTTAGFERAGSAARTGGGRPAAPTGGSRAALAGDAAAGLAVTRPAGTSGSGPVSAPVRNADPDTANSPARSAPGPGGPTAATGGGARAPIKLGQIGVRGGIVGGALMPFYEGVIAWVNDVNRRGGLAGHPVQLIAVDDGDDPRRALAAAKRLVEVDKVVAIYGQSMLPGFVAVIPYLEAQQMPTVGSIVSHTSHERTPIYFNVAWSPRTGLAWNHLMPLKLFPPGGQGCRHPLLRRSRGLQSRQLGTRRDRPPAGIQDPLHRPGQRRSARLHRRGPGRPQRRCQSPHPPDRQPQRHPDRRLRPPSGLRPVHHHPVAGPHGETPPRRRQRGRGLPRRRPDAPLDLTAARRLPGGLQGLRPGRDRPVLVRHHLLDRREAPGKGGAPPGPTPPPRPTSWPACGPSGPRPSAG